MNGKARMEKTTALRMILKIAKKKEANKGFESGAVETAS